MKSEIPDDALALFEKVIISDAFPSIPKNFDHMLPFDHPIVEQFIMRLKLYEL